MKTNPDIKGSARDQKPEIRNSHEDPSPLRTVVVLDQNWLFRNAGDPSFPFLPASQFPTNVHLDLLHLGIIPDPYIAKNEELVQWVGEQTWTYKTTFATPELSNRRAALDFQSLDTHVTVRLNGEKVLSAENMFVSARVEVTKHLRKSGCNVLELTFGSTFLIGKQIAGKYPGHHWGCWNGDTSRLAVRKAQYHYGWDWGPMLMTCGPCRPITLETYHSRISDLYFSIDVDGSLKSAEVATTAEVEGAALLVRFEVYYDRTVVAHEVAEVTNGAACAVFKIQNPQLWYPARYGRQCRYSLHAVLLDGSKICDTACRKFGIRKVVLVQRNLKAAFGNTFLFMINNIPIFCGGSNWIPADLFTPRIDASKYQKWAKLAVDGRHVMLRIWGGGIYEEDALYDACDELGLLVWQDFMFACGAYPAFPAFLASVEREATANVKRLRHHPSIVIWAGNNEDYQYCESENLNYDPKDTDPQNWLKSTFPARYIYEKLLPDVMRKVAPGSFYHFGSPFGGRRTSDPTVGDIHQWNVWHGTQEKYQDFGLLSGRFVSEFGMEAFPTIRTIDGYLEHGEHDIDRYPQSSTVDFHNKAAGHERRLALYLSENIQYKFSPFEHYIYCTQLIQAECLATAYRLWKRQWQGPGREFCAGALVWQLNDCWPGQSWSIADYYLRPKLAYYAIKRELADITVGMQRISQPDTKNDHTHASAPQTPTVQLWVTNLTLSNRIYALHLQAWDIMTGQEPHPPPSNLPDLVPLPPNRSVEIAEFALPLSNNRTEKGANNSFRTVIAAYLLDPTTQRQIARYVNWPEPLKYVHLQVPRALEYKIASNKEGKNYVELRSDVPVKGVALEVEKELVDDVVFDDNCVDLVPGETVWIGVRGLDAGQEDRLTVRYLEGGGGGGGGAAAAAAAAT